MTFLYNRKTGVQKMPLFVCGAQHCTCLQIKRRRPSIGRARAITDAPPRTRTIITQKVYYKLMALMHVYTHYIEAGISHSSSDSRTCNTSALGIFFGNHNMYPFVQTRRNYYFVALYGPEHWHLSLQAHMHARTHTHSRTHACWHMETAQAELHH